ncbi:pH-response regulator protein palF/RIM8 [Lasiodiplodia hormozganensis]|uniref:PH-response regulator protein palF/RIM8 n=1 Tax=Lasiodiplodia hormozganensis TaxID=869390 RepID=A0AA39XXX1_9PEZI|nr:pH-response regulator protein palF/RIM8 [Lasiodiplodia hormozganensis]
MPTSTARASPTTSLSPSPGPGRSLLLRIKSPFFGSKARHISEFYIKPDDPHRQYSPGDIITGAVILKVVKPIRVTHIVVSLHGYVQVYKNPNSPGDGYRSHYSAIATGKGSRIGGYFGNGFASLFEDEVVLCGEGRLGEGTYQFNFELEFPSKGLPSSIDFERGTISYMLTSTMTRPTTIMPTATCDRKIYLIESIDIAPLIRPKPRIVTLERVSRRSRAKSKVKKGTNTGSGSNGEGSSGDQSNGQPPTEPSRSSRVSELSEEVDTPGSPAPSDTSFESHFSSSQGGSSNASGALSARGTESGKQGSSKSVFVDKKPITATIELLKAGFLRGDSIPLKICVSHTKHVQNLRGIIVTLYRQARVDMHPAIPVVMNAKGEKVSSEDYYPKSKTGLGGLSLSSAGSSHVFRKDLAQSFAPLIVDPRTRTAEVKASVRVPDDAFPSITSVPGAMISFKYYVEIVVDLQGKLTGLDKYFSNSGMMLASAPQLGKAEDTNSGVFSAWGGHFLDTEPLRRDKGVVSCVFEVIVGTRDSDRRKGKRRATSDNELDHPLSVNGDVNDLNEERSQLTGYASQQAALPLQTEQDNYYYGQPLYGEGYSEEVPHPYAHPTYPVSDLTNEDALPEKERLRRAEARLMPSQPPVEGGSSAADAIHVPSAPVIPEERPSMMYQAASSADVAGPSAPPPVAFGPPSPTASEETAAPTYEERQGEPSHSSQPAATDDKHELARRRLEMDRSAPDEVLNEGGAGDNDSSPSAPPVVTLAPSAPVLTDEEYVFPSTHPTDLPRYER